MINVILSCDCHVTGARIHTDVWDHKMMSVIRQTCNKLTQDSIASKSLCVNLKASVSARARVCICVCVSVCVCV